MWIKFLYNEPKNVDLAIPLWNSVYILIIGIGSLGIFAYIFHLSSYDLRSYAPLLGVCGPSPDPPNRRDSLLKEKKRNEKVGIFQVLKNPPPMRNGVVWSRHLLFIFVLKMGKIKEEQKPLMTSMEKAVYEN